MLLSYPRPESGSRRLYQIFGTMDQSLRHHTTNTNFCGFQKSVLTRQDELYVRRWCLLPARCLRIHDLRGRKLEAAAQILTPRAVSTLPVVINSNQLALYSLSITKRRCCYCLCCSVNDHVILCISSVRQVFWFVSIHKSLKFWVLQIFTFLWPCCVVTNFFVIKPTRCTNFTNLFCHETLHVSKSSSVHHQEFIHCTLSNGIWHTAFDQDQNGTVVPSWSCSKAVYKPVWHIPLLIVQWINSWWWTEELSETCRVSCQNKFVKLVHLFGFIIKKSYRCLVILRLPWRMNNLCCCTLLFW